MDEKYIVSLYNYLSSQDARFKQSLSEDAFISSMKDSGYASDIYGYLSSKDPSFKSSLSEDAFLSEVGASKKKDESASTATEEVSVSESQQPQETTTSGTSQPVQVELPQFDVYESDATTVSQPGLTFEQPQFGGRRVLEPIKPYDAFQVTPLQRDVARVDQPRLVVDTDPRSELTKTIGQIERVEEQQTFTPSPISRPTVTTSMDVPTLTEQDIADLKQARKEQAEAEARTKLIELGQPDAEEIIQPDAAPADATRVVGPDLVIPEEREITIQELAGRQEPSAPSPFEPAAVDATFSQTAADIAKIDPSEEAVQKRIEEEEKEFAEDQLKRQLGIFSLEDNTIIEDVFGKNTVTNFIGDIYRSAGQGQAQGAVVDDAITLMRRGPNATDADIMQFIEAYNRMVESGSSDEMRDFNKVYEESGGGLVGFWNGFKSNPSVFPQLFVSSASAMFNPASLVAGAAAAGTGFLASGPGGAAVLGMGAVSSALESALTYAELLQEEIGVNTPMTIENVRAVLSQPGIQDRLTWKSTGRGLTIGAIEGLTAGLGVKATSLVTGRTGSKLVGGLTGTAVEGAGGATGEVLGTIVSGKDPTFLEAAFEGTVGGLTTAPITVGMGIRDAMTKGQYKINDGVATKEQVVSLLETGTDADIAGTKLDIQNDPELRTAAEDAKARVRNNAEIKAELAQAGVIDNNKADAIVPLEVEKQKLSGNTTEAGKRRLKEINDQINSILDEPTAVTTETEAVRIYEGKDKDGNTKQVKLTTQEDGRIRLDIVNDDGSTSLIGDFPAESTDTDVVSGIIDTDQDFNIVKPEDAIQESSTETVDVQEPTRDSEAVGERDATGPVTTEGEAEVQVEETPVTVREEAADLAAMVGEELQAPAPTTEAAPAVTEETNIDEFLSQEPVPKRLTTAEANILKDKLIDQYRDMKRNPQFRGDQGWLSDIAEYFLENLKKISDQTDFTDGAVSKDRSLYEEIFPKDVRSGKRKFTREEADDKINLLKGLIKQEDFLYDFPKFIQLKGSEFDVYVGKGGIAQEAKSDIEQVLSYTEPDVAKDVSLQKEESDPFSPEISYSNYVDLGFDGTIDDFNKKLKDRKVVVGKENDFRMYVPGDVIVDKPTGATFRVVSETQMENVLNNKIIDIRGDETNFSLVTPAPPAGSNKASSFNVGDLVEDKDGKRYEITEPIANTSDVQAVDLGTNQALMGHRSGPRVSGFNPNYFGLKLIFPTTEAAPTVEETATVTTEAAPVAEGVDPFYDSVEAQQKQEERISKLAAKARTAIKKILPDAKVILHKTEAEYNKATKANSKGSQGGAGSRGVLIGDTIHVNMPHANDRTIAHEVFHALLTNLSKENSVDVIALTKKMAASLRGKIKDKEILAELDKFVDQYSGEVDAIQAEEMVAEFMGILAERYNSFDKPTKGVVQRFLERLADLLGLRKTFVPSARTRKGQQTTVALLETLAGKVATGQQIFEEDIMALVPYKDGQPDFQAAPDNLTVQEIDDMAMAEMEEFQREATERQLSYKEQILFNEGVQVTREEYIANRGKPDAKNIRYAKLFTKEPGVDAKAMELSDRYGIEITEEDIFDYIDQRADTKGKFTEKNLKFLRDNDLLELGQRFQGPPKSPKQQMAELAEDYNINVKGFLSTQINDGILRPKLRKLGYELRRHSGGFSIRDANDRMYRPPTGRGAGRKFQLFGGKDANVAEILTIAKESNITRQATKEFLISNRGLTAKQADKLLNVSTANMYTMPVSFGNIGLNDGIALFERVANYADKIAKDKKVKVMDRLPMTLEFLEKQPEYIAQADKKTKGPSTIQMQMQSDVQKALGLKKTANMSERLKAFNEKVRQRKKGARDLKATQRDLRNFIRQALPEGVYKKPDVVRMMSDITKLKPQDESNMQKITDDVIKRVTKMQVEFLQKKIDTILNGKYDTVQSGRKKGRKIDPDTKNRFKLRIKPFLLGPDATLENVLADNQSYYSRISELDNKLNRSILEDENMLDLMAIIHLNESLLYNNDEVNKVEALQKAEDILSGILGEGIQAFKQLIQQRKETKMANASMIFEDSIGLELNEDNIEQFSNMKDFQPKVNRKKLKNTMTRKFDDAIKSTYNSIRSFMQAEESLEGLIDRIMEAPGAAIGGKTLEFVYGGINEASRTFKENLMNVKEFTIEDLNKSFGKNKWQKAVSEGVVQDFTGVYVDPKQVEEARAEYKKNPTEKNKRKFDFIEAKNNILLSENEIAFLWAQYQDPANKASFENPDNDNFGPDHKRIMDELVATIDPGHLKFAKLMANKMQSRYKVYNDSYRKIYLTDMPFNGFYAGRIYREGVDDRFSIDLMGDYEKMMKVVSAQSQKVRSNTTRPIKPVDLYNNMSNYYTDMEWAAAYGPTMKEINDAFNVPAVKQAIEYVGGKDLLGYINDVFEKIATKGIDTQKNTGMLNFMNDFFVGTRLGLNPTIALKQLTSIPTYADAIGPKNWLKNSSFANIGDIKRTWKEVMDNSVYLKDRVSEDFRRTVANYTTEQSKDIIPFLSKNKFQNALMFFGRAGDIGAIYLGGLPNYRYYKSEFRNENPNATEQEVIDYAIRKFEKDTKTTQQSNDIQDKSYTQSSNAFMRGINMFKTTPKQYLRKEFAGIRKMRRAYRDQGFTSTDFWRGARQFAMFHSIMPATFQYVAMGLPGLLSDFDDEDAIDIIRAVLLGNINGLFLIGDVLNGLVDAGLGKPYAGNLAELPLTDEVNELIKYYGWMNRSSKQKTKEKWGNKFYVRLFELVVGAGARKVGLPVLPLYNMQQYYSNLEKAADAKTGGEVVQRVLGYTDYVIEGSKKGGSSGASSSRGGNRGGRAKKR